MNFWSLFFNLSKNILPYFAYLTFAPLSIFSVFTSIVIVLMYVTFEVFVYPWLQAISFVNEQLNIPLVPCFQ